MLHLPHTNKRLKKNISFLRTSGENSVFTGFSGFSFRFFSVLVFIFQITFLSAQDHLATNNGESPAILAIKDGALIFSTDDNFNNQIFDKKIIIADSKIAYTTNKGLKQIIVSNGQSTISSDKNLAGSLKETATKKKNDGLKNITKEIAKYEAKKKHFQSEKINVPFSTTHFYTLQNTTKNYVTPTSPTDIDKLSGKIYNFNIQRALDFLHSKKFNDYNTNSLDCCFSTVYSIRPPPFLN